MRDRTLQEQSSADRGVTGRRLLAAVSAFIFIATLSLFIGHHHADEGDTSPCLICNSVCAPAIQCENVVPAVVRAPAFPVPLREHGFQTLPGWPGFKDVRAPPSC